MRKVFYMALLFLAADTYWILNDGTTGTVLFYSIVTLALTAIWATLEIRAVNKSKNDYYQKR